MLGVATHRAPQVLLREGLPIETFLAAVFCASWRFKFFCRDHSETLLIPSPPPGSLPRTQRHVVRGGQSLTSEIDVVSVEGSVEDFPQK